MNVHNKLGINSAIYLHRDTNSFTGNVIHWLIKNFMFNYIQLRIYIILWSIYYIFNYMHNVSKVSFTCNISRLIFVSISKIYKLHQ